MKILDKFKVYLAKITSPVAMPHFLLSCIYENFTQNSTFFLSHNFGKI
jgi:hypothetical protein